MGKFFSGNPVFMRFWRSNMRPQTFYPALGVMIIILFMIYLSNRDFINHKYLLGILIGFQAFILQLLGAVFIFFHITRAKESNMMEFLRITPLSSKKIATGFILGAPINCIVLATLLLPIIIISAIASGISWIFYPVYLIGLLTSTLFIYALIAFFSYTMKGKISIFVFIIIIPMIIQLLIAVFSYTSMGNDSNTMTMFFSNFSFLPLLYSVIGEDTYLFGEYSLQRVISAFIFLLVQQLFYMIFIFNQFYQKIKNTDKHFIISRTAPIWFMLSTTFFMVIAFIQSRANRYEMDYMHDSFSSSLSGIPEDIIFFGIMTAITAILCAFFVVPNKEKVIKWAMRLKDNTNTSFIKKYIFDKDAPATSILLVYAGLVVICIAIFNTVYYSLNQDKLVFDQIFFEGLKYAFTLIYCGCFAQYFHLTVPKYGTFYTGLCLFILWVIIPIMGAISGNGDGVMTAFLPFLPIDINGDYFNSLGLLIALTLALATFLLTKIIEQETIAKTKRDV